MTDDIVKHLRDTAWCKHYNDGGNNPSGKLMEEAAAEITHLRAENETLRRDVKTAVMGDSAELSDVKRANKMLRKALLEVYDNSLGLDPDKMTDNIEWVTAEIRAAREALESGDE